MASLPSRRPPRRIIPKAKGDNTIATDEPALDLLDGIAEHQAIKAAKAEGADLADDRAENRVQNRALLTAHQATKEAARQRELARRPAISATTATDEDIARYVRGWWTSVDKLAKATEGTRERLTCEALLAAGHHCAAGTLDENEAKRAVEAAIWTNGWLKDDWNSDAAQFWKVKGNNKFDTGMKTPRDYSKVGKRKTQAKVTVVDELTAKRKAKAEAETEPKASGTRKLPPSVKRTPEQQRAALANAHKVFRRWFGKEYDLDALDATMAAGAVERLPGDPVWLLLVSGSGGAKTETVLSLTGFGAIPVSAIASDGALLSASGKRDRTADATGGLMREIGERGILALKDMTSILSQNRDQRGAVLSALRDIYDGKWIRSVGTDGGRKLDWTGRIIVVGAVTTAWDTAHAVIASMGDRFVLCRMDSNGSAVRASASHQAIANTGDEIAMRAELAAAVARVLKGAATEPADLTSAEVETIAAAADFVTRARTAVDHDYQGNVIDCHAAEMPTRFAKQLVQIMRGGIAIGMPRDAALRLAIRCARDSVNPLRLLVIEWVADNEMRSVSEIRHGINKPRSTVDRVCQALEAIGIFVCDESIEGADFDKRTRWRYSLASGIAPDVLKL